MYYKDLEVYKKSIELVKEIYKLTVNFPKDEVFGITSQIKRAVISIPSNIAEGCARFSNKDTARFIDIALGSIAEVDTQITIAKELNYIADIEGISRLLNQVNALLLGFKKHLNKNDE
jgi:four helix bundle protein